MKTLMLLILLCQTSCATLKPRVPLFETFWSIHKEPYIVDVNDCSDKADKYMVALKAKGYATEVVVIRLSTGELHAVVHVDNIYVDPTSGDYSSMLKGKYQYVATSFIKDELL